jgi:hypothetical protein
MTRFRAGLVVAAVAGALILVAPALGQQRAKASLVPMPGEAGSPAKRVIPPMRWKQAPLQSVAPPQADAGASGPP